MIIPDTQTLIYCDFLTSKARPFVTQPFRRSAFETIHGLLHPGANATVKLVTQRFVWPRIKADCRQWARGCNECPKAKMSRHVINSPGSLISPTSRFSHIHLDIVIMPYCEGFRYCLTIIVRFTRWPEAIPLENIETTTVARALYSGWIARFRTPLRITTDRGTQFESDLFKQLTSLTGATHFRTTAYHPAANGMVERAHRYLKTPIKCHTDNRWTEILPTVLLGIRSAWRSDLEATSAELVYGEPLHLPGEFLTEPSEQTPARSTGFIQDLRRHFQNLRPKPPTRHSSKSTFVFQNLQTAKHVFVRPCPR